LLRVAVRMGLASLLMLVSVLPVMAKSDQVFDTFTLYYENDFLAGTDRDYTNGLKLTWSTPYTADAPAANWPGWIYPLLERLPFVNDPAQQRALSLSFGQEIYTPEDKKSVELIVDDRPYAGMTYLAVGLQSKSLRRQNTWELNVGILGPASLAEGTQKLIHKIVNGAQNPKGWEHQLGNELTIDAVYETQWKLGTPGFPRTFSSDLIPHLGARVGTVKIYANAGGEFRFGWDLPEDFGNCAIRAGCVSSNGFEKRTADHARRKKLGLHFFVAADGRLVLRDIFLDGNTFRDSHSVDSKLFVADLSSGISVRYGKAKATFSHIYRTKQFESQNNEQIFSSLSLSWRF